MRIRFLISMASPTWSIVPGDVVDWPEDAAQAHLAAGNAVAVEPETETATQTDPAEQAVLPRARKR